MNFDINDTILIVTGSELVPEEKDRPLAYRLKGEMDPKGRSAYQHSIVVSDRWYLDNEIFQVCTSVLIGGPGVNAVTAALYQQIPMWWSFQDLAFMQMSVENPVKVALWGMNQSGTDLAVNYFISDHLPNLLAEVWKVEPESPE